MRKWVAEVATLAFRNALRHYPESRYVHIVKGFMEGRELSDEDIAWLEENIRPLQFRFYRSPGTVGRVGLHMDWDIGTAVATLALYLADADGSVVIRDCETCGQPFLAARKTASICYTCPRSVPKDRPRRG